MDVSVILATRDRAGLLRETLGHLERQEAGAVRWEVVVVDNGSRDGTPQVLEAATGRLPLVALAEPRPGKNRAMNRALEAARGALLLFSDDDVIADPGWVAGMAAASGRWPAADVFGGEIRLAFPAGTPAWLREPFHPALNFARYRFDQPEGPVVPPPNGPNYAVRARALAGLRFHEDIGPDGTAGYAMGSETELLQRLRAAGAQTIYVPSAVVHHVVQPHQLETRYLLRRSFRLGRGEVRRTRDRARPVPFLLGAPRHLWREAMGAGVHWAASLGRDRRRRLEAGLRLWNLAGGLAEHLASPRRPA